MLWAWLQQQGAARRRHDDEPSDAGRAGRPGPERARGGSAAYPETVATPLSAAVLTDFFTANAFLFEGADPIQRDYTEGSLAPHRFAIVRGQVLTRAGDPLPGVRVTSPEQAVP